MKVSNSEIQTFKRCKRKWWFAYYRSLAPRREETAGPRALGTRVHACVAEYYNPAVVGFETARRVNSLALHERLIAEDVERCGDDQLRAAEVVKESDLSRAMLEGYFDWLEESGADEGMTVVAPEQSVTHDLDVFGTPVTVMGKLDLRVRRLGAGDEEDMFLDHKTVMEFTTPTRTLHLDEQMKMYDWLCEKTTGHAPSGAIYNMIRKVKRTGNAKPPFYARFEVKHSRSEMKSFEVRLRGVIGDMIQTRMMLDNGADPNGVAYPTPNRNCSWDCDFFPVCPLVDRADVGGGESLIETLYAVQDQYARYEERELDGEV
jgi:hypothetical protein